MIPVEPIDIPVPQEAPVETVTPRKRAVIGLPKCDNPAEKRFPLTPEAVGVLTRNGFVVSMQQGAADSIHYGDNAYVKAGARIVTRRVALQADIVIHLAPLDVVDLRQLRRGALLLSLANFNRKQAVEVVDICFLVLSVMEFDGAGAYGRLQGIDCIG